MLPLVLTTGLKVPVKSGVPALEGADDASCDRTGTSWARPIDGREAALILDGSAIIVAAERYDRDVADDVVIGPVVSENARIDIVENFLIYVDER